MIQQTETRFRINDWKKKNMILLDSPPFIHKAHKIVNQFHMYAGGGYTNRTKDMREKLRVKIKNRKVKIPFDITVFAFV